MLTTVKGQNFNATCVAHWAGAAQATTFVDDRTLTFTAPTAAAAIGSYQITVIDTAVPKTAIGSCPFTITAVPILTVVCPLQPASVLVNSGAQPITVKGTLFTAASIVMLDGVDQTTTFVNDTTLTFSFTPGAVAATNTVSVKDGANTAVMTCPLQTTLTPLLTVTCPTTPATAVAGSPTPLTVTVRGTNFTATTIATADGIDQATTFVNATTITFPLAIPATVPANQIIKIGARDGANTAVAICDFTVTPVAAIMPIVTSVFPDYVGVSDARKTITVTGQNFLPTSVVVRELSDVVTTYVNATTLTFQSEAPPAPSYMANMFVRNDTVKSTTSAPYTCVFNPVPNAVQPASAPSGGAGTILLKLAGNSMGSTAVMQVDGVDVASTHPIGGELHYQLPISPTPRTHQIGVRLGHAHGAQHDNVVPVPMKTIPFTFT
jgi:hypothetical protein